MNNETHEILEGLRIAFNSLRIRLAKKYGVEDNFGILRPLMTPEETSEFNEMQLLEETLMEEE